MSEDIKIKAENLTLKTCLLQAQNACLEITDKYRKLEEENTRLTGELYGKGLDCQVDLKDSLQKENEELRKVLKTYADDDSWSVEGSQKCPAITNGDVYYCEHRKGFVGGMAARDVLQKLGEVKKEEK